MQLLLNATSPFARLARVVALEKGLGPQLSLCWCDPWNNDPALLTQHPQARIPVLITDDGQALSESLLIALYLDHIGPGPSLLPASQYSAVLARTSVAYGLMEAAFQVVIARKYDGQDADHSLLGQRRLAAIERALAQLEGQATTTPATPSCGGLTLDHITQAIALEYLRFRLPALWPAPRYPQLHAWAAALAQRPSMADTAFG